MVKLNQKEYNMSVQPKSENFRKAFKWVAEERKFSPGKEVKALVEEAGLKFNLSPKEAEFLMRTLLEEK
jgi:hypothetical protein